MGSIPKIVLTPLKWVSKQVLHRTLLRFPGGDAHDPIACTYCPEMCRFACPAAVTSANDAVTPCNKMSLLHKEERWPKQAAAGGPLWPLYDCTGCGRCTEFCVYGMPVAEILFEARKEFPWEKAKQVAAALTDEEDTVGDLADELADSAHSVRRMTDFVRTAGDTIVVTEARSLYFLLRQGVAAQLSWERELDDHALERWKERLAGKTWLLHESVWMSRRLEQADRVSDWVQRARKIGILIELPFHHGRGCIDCGGEGAYSRLFLEQARQMARDFWERDQHRAQGILCLSPRCAQHLREALGNQVPIVALGEKRGEA
ncbi:hypothetical protein WDW37_05990 [Bdellovibrionota bacterium FG-1]